MLPLLPITFPPFHPLHHWLWRRYPECLISYNFHYFPELFVALELSVEALVLIHSKMPCYSNFYKYLHGKKRLGSITVSDKVMEFPWIGLTIGMHWHGPDHFHIHGIELKDNVELKQIDNISPKGKEPKEVWGYCKS